MITDLRTADWSTPAVVLKFDQNMLHHGSLGVIRSLGRLGVPVYGVHEGPGAPAASSRYLAGRFFWQPRPDDPQRTVSGLLSLASRIGRRAVLYATDDAGAIFLAEHGDPLRDAFAFPRPPADLPVHDFNLAMRQQAWVLPLLAAARRSSAVRDRGAA